MKAGNDNSIRLALSLVPILAGVYFFVSCLTNAQVKSDRERDDLSGSVQVVRTERSLLLRAGDKPSNQKGETTQVSYARNGSKTEEITYSDNGMLLRKSTFVYDSSGKLTETMVFNADNSVYLKRTYKYLAERSTEECVYGEGTFLITKSIKTHDKKGRVIDLSTFDSNGKPQMRQVITYTIEGKPVEIDYFQDHNSQIGKTLFVYDSEGNLTQKTDYDAHGSISGRIVFSGDTKGGADLTMTEYDSKGSLVSKERYIREFDSHGNWTKETKSIMNSQTGELEPVEITQRQITYY